MARPPDDGLRPPPANQPLSGQDELKRRSQDLGIFGKLFGSRENAPINVAGAVIVLGILASTVSLIWPGIHTADFLKMMGGLVIAALTFLGGYLGKGR